MNVANPGFYRIITSLAASTNIVELAGRPILASAFNGEPFSGGGAGRASALASGLSSFDGAG